MLRLLLLTVPLMLFCFGAGAQSKILPAVKTISSPKIDGNLEDEAWKQAPVATSFVQNFPNFGLPASTRTEVRILYDNTAIYIGAYLYDDPALIRKQITARDEENQQDADFFSVFFDTYNDQQNGFQFLVTPSNVQTDAKLTPSANPGFREFGDKTWDAVWISKTQIRKDGWVVEMRIPYISLRFSKKDIQTWGLQFLRFTRRDNETSYWNPVDPNINGFVNQFGKYAELKDITPPLRLSFSPYITGGVRYNPEGSRKETEVLRNGGMDVKYGINESFTLDATLIPDFGQVVSDNVINNLSPFEVRFQENRPFFTEGTELFNKSGLFYSRRIGSTPGGYFNVEDLVANDPNLQVVRNPSITQLYNGIKFSGRTKKKLGIGIFNAVAAPMKARLRNLALNKDTLIETEPLSNYNIIVLDQALNGRSSITFTNANVQRHGPGRDANVTAFDWSLYTKDNNYRFAGTGRYSKIFGYTPYNGAINLIYDTITRDGKLYVKPYDGFNTTVQFSKVNGKIRYYLGNNITANSYDPNDLGYLQTANQVNYTGGVSYNQLTPVGHFNQYIYRFDISSQYLYKPYKYSEVELSASAFYYFRNFWDVTFSVSSYPFVQHDYFELRTPGLFVKRPAEVTFGVNGSTDSRKRFYVGYGLGVAARPNRVDNGYNSLELFLRYRFSDQFTMNVNWGREYESNQIGYAFARENNGDPILGYRDFTETATLLSGIYNFTPRLNFSLRARHYWNKVIYNSFYNVDKEGNHLPRAFISGRDENYNGFNVDAFLTWDFRLGSRVILGYKNWLGDNYSVNGTLFRNYTDNIERTFRASHGNELTLKIIYFLDYNQLRKKH